MKILAFGEVMMRMMPLDYKRLEQTHTLEYLFTGTGVNVLAGLAKMGDSCFFSTVLPNNNVGFAASATVRSLNISDEFIKYKGDHIGVYFLEKGIGGRTSQVTYLNRKASSFSMADPDDYDLEKILDGIDVLHVCGISLAISDNTRKIALNFVKTAKKMNIKVIFDCNFRSSLWDENDLKHSKEIYEEMLMNADIVFATEKDAIFTLGYDSKYSEEKDIRVDVLTRMRKDYKIEAIAGTIRGNNCLRGYFLDDNGYIESDIYDLFIYDRIGGGDAFAAGFIHAFHNFEDRKQIINYATCSGVLGHTTYGDSPMVTKKEIIDYMENGNLDVKR